MICNTERPYEALNNKHVETGCVIFYVNFVLMGYL